MTSPSKESDQAEDPVQQTEEDIEEVKTEKILDIRPESSPQSSNTK